MNLGFVLLIFVLTVSLIILFFLARSASGNMFNLVTSRQLFYLTTILLFFALMFLLSAFLNDEFKYLYVYQNSSRSLPPIYKFAAVWAGKEGSFLLWAFILNITGVIVTRTEHKNENIIMAVITMTQIFILLLLIAESPFRFIWDAYPEHFKAGIVPMDMDGEGMNPLLIDPWMVVHPPVLFLGYATATVPFGYAVAALLKKEYKEWIKPAYPWVLFSLVTLGVGIFLGGYWAYKVLGWGGFWGWDPVENSSLIPWLVVVALMHGMLIQKRKGSLVKTNLILAMAYFILVFYSTFLTRSGVLSNFSVHSFGAGGISGYLLYFIIFYLFISVFLMVKGYKGIESAALSNRIWTWENLTVYGLMTLVIYSLIILAGTSMPIISGLFVENPTAVTERFYNNLSVPLGLLIMGLMVAATIAALGQHFQKRAAMILAAAALLLALVFNAGTAFNPVAYIFTAAALFMVFSYLSDMVRFKIRLVLASRLTHLGVGIFIIGVIASGYHSTTFQKELEIGKEELVGPVALTFTGFNEGEKSSVSFTIRESSGTKDFKTDYYVTEKTNSLYREPYIMSGLFGDIYITPQEYHSGITAISLVNLSKGEEKKVGDLTVKFTGFRTEGMTAGMPVVYTDLEIDGRRVSPGFKIIEGHRHPIDAKIPGSGRVVTLRQVDVNNHAVELFIDPGKDSTVPPDSIIVDLSVKRMIWLVWAGTVLIALGGIVTLVQRAGKD